MMEYLVSQSLFNLQHINITSLSSYAHGFMACNLANWLKLAEEMAIQESSQIGKNKIEECQIYKILFLMYIYQYKRFIFFPY